MATDAGAGLQRDEMLTETDEAAISAAIKAALMDVHTTMPGIVRSFNAAEQTVTVQPVHQRIYFEKGAVELPLLIHVPVVFPRWGSFIMTGPVASGDPCVLHFSERAIDDWWQAGGTRAPSEHRFHDLSDAFAVPGGSSKPQAGQVAGGAAPDAVEIRTLDGTTVVRIEDSKVYLGAKAAGIGGLGSRAPLVGKVGDLTDPLIAWMTAVGTATGAGPPLSTMFATKVEAK